MKQLKARLREFNRERDWEKYHSPKNLAMALAAEAGELQEIFMWLTEEESRALDDKKLAQLREELGDLMVFLTNLADKFGLDPIECAKAKIDLNARKYPKEVVRGKSKKYSEY